MFNGYLRIFHVLGNELITGCISTLELCSFLWRLINAILWSLFTYLLLNYNGFFCYCRFLCLFNHRGSRFGNLLLYYRNRLFCGLLFCWSGNLLEGLLNSSNFCFQFLCDFTFWCCKGVDCKTSYGKDEQGFQHHPSV